MHEAERHDQFVAQGFAGGRRVNERPDDRGRRQAAAPAMAALTLAVVQHESSRRPSAAHALRRQPQRQGVPPRAGAASNSGSSASLPLRTTTSCLVVDAETAALVLAVRRGPANDGVGRAAGRRLTAALPGASGCLAAASGQSRSRSKGAARSPATPASPSCECGRDGHHDRVALEGEGTGCRIIVANRA